MRVRAVALESGTDREANRAASRSAVVEAVTAGADLVVLPEYSSAFDPQGVGPEHAEPIDGPFVAALAQQTQVADVTVIAGTAVPGSDGRASNLVVALRGGMVIGTYAKVHLYDAFGTRESDRLVPGPADAEPLVLDIAGASVGVMTCYDLRFAESARRLVDAGAQVIVVPSAWAAGPRKLDHWRTLLRARAIENVAWVIGAPMGGAGVVGEPIVVDPWGEVVAEGSPAIDVDVDPELVTQVRAVNPSLDNRRYRVVPR